MKHHHTLLLAAIAVLCLPVVSNAVTLTQAQLTLIIKDVKTIDPAKGARPAEIKETVQGDQGVRTGLASRTELLFNDKTITRLGASTHFSFAEGTRDMTLQNGAMLLQVPKGIGGATIATPAVTAGVTGTTIMLLSSIKLSKFIVLEGNGYFQPKGKMKNGKPFPKVLVHAGEEIIYLNGSPIVPAPVYVSLKVLEATSLLLTGKWGVTLNMGPILAAANGQGPDNFANGNGAANAGGTVTTIAKLPQNPGQTAPPPPPPPPPPEPPHNTIR